MGHPPRQRGGSTNAPFPEPSPEMHVIMLGNMLEQIRGEAESETNDASTGTETTGHPPVSRGSSAADNQEAQPLAESGPDEAGPPVEFDAIFELLSNGRRREVLRYLVQETDRVRLGTLAEEIAADECGKPVSRVSSKERKRVYVGLYQCHLPKMDDMGAVSYNKPRGVITPGPNFEVFVEYLPPEEGYPDAAKDRPDWMPSLTGFIG